MEAHPTARATADPVEYVTDLERHEKANQLMSEAGQLQDGGNTLEAMKKIQEADTLVPYIDEGSCF